MKKVELEIKNERLKQNEISDFTLERLQSIENRALNKFKEENGLDGGTN